MIGEKIDLLKKYEICTNMTLPLLLYCSENNPATRVFKSIEKLTIYRVYLNSII